MKAIINCPICYSGKIWTERWSHRIDAHLEYECLCRGCCRKFTFVIKVEEVKDAKS